MGEEDNKDVESSGDNDNDNNNQLSSSLSSTEKVTSIVKPLENEDKITVDIENEEEEEEVVEEVDGACVIADDKEFLEIEFSASADTMLQLLPKNEESLIGAIVGGFMPRADEGNDSPGPLEQLNKIKSGFTLIDINGEDFTNASFSHIFNACKDPKHGGMERPLFLRFAKTKLDVLVVTKNDISSSVKGGEEEDTKEENNRIKDLGIKIVNEDDNELVLDIDIKYDLLLQFEPLNGTNSTGAKVIGFVPEDTNNSKGPLERSNLVEKGYALSSMNKEDASTMDYTDILNACKSPLNGGLSRPITLGFKKKKEEVGFLGGLFRNIAAKSPENKSNHQQQPKKSSSFWTRESSERISLTATSNEAPSTAPSTPNLVQKPKLSFWSSQEPIVGGAKTELNSFSNSTNDLTPVASPPGVVQQTSFWGRSPTSRPPVPIVKPASPRSSVTKTNEEKEEDTPNKTEEKKDIFSVFSAVKPSSPRTSVTRTNDEKEEDTSNKTEEKNDIFSVFSVFADNITDGISSIGFDTVFYNDLKQDLEQLRIEESGDFLLLKVNERMIGLKEDEKYLSIEWYRKDEKLDGQVKGFYRITPDDFDFNICAKVTLVATPLKGSVPLTVSSNEIAIDKPEYIISQLPTNFDNMMEPLIFQNILQYKRAERKYKLNFTNNGFELINEKDRAEAFSFTSSSFLALKTSSDVLFQIRTKTNEGEDFTLFLLAESQIQRNIITIAFRNLRDLVISPDLLEEVHKNDFLFYDELVINPIPERTEIANTVKDIRSYNSDITQDQVFDILQEKMVKLLEQKNLDHLETCKNLTNHRQLVESLSHEIREIEKEIKMLAQDRKTMKKEVSTMTNRLSQKQDALVAEQEAKKAAELKCTKATNDLKNLKSEIEEKEKVILKEKKEAETKADAEKIGEEEEAEKSASSSTEEDGVEDTKDDKINALEESLKECHMEILELTKKNDVLGKQIFSNSTFAEKVEAELEEALQKNSDLETKIKVMKKNMRKTMESSSKQGSEDIDQYKKQVKELEDKISILLMEKKNDSEEKSNEKSKWEDEKLSMQYKITEYEENCEEYQQIIRDQGSENEKAELKVEELEKQLQENKYKYDESLDKQKENELLTRCERLATERNSLKNKFESLSRQVKGLTKFGDFGVIEKALSEHSELLSNNVKMNAELVESQNKYEALAKAINGGGKSSKDEKKKAAFRTVELESLVNTLTASVNDKQLEVNMHKLTNESLAARIKELESVSNNEAKV